MRRLIKFIPKKAGLLIIILVLQQVSLVFSYSIEKIELMTEKNVVHALPLFVVEENYGIKGYGLHPYFHDDIERVLVLNAATPEKIMSEGLRSEKFLAHFIKVHNKKIDHQQASQLAEIYVEEAKLEGINHDIAFVQMCHETGFLSYTGSVKAKQNNFCGMGASSKYKAGDSFETVRTGIRAHIQHLKAYADKADVTTTLVDTRFELVKRGSAITVNELTGKWAEDPAYGTKINRLIEDLYNL